MVVNDNAASLTPREGVRFFASNRAPTHTQSDNVRLSIAAGMLGPQLHGRLL